MYLSAQRKMQKGLRTIGQYAFSGCTGLRKIALPEGATTIAKGAFANDTGLKYIYIPQSLTGIEDSAFFRCTNLTDVYYGGNENSWNAITIYGGQNASGSNGYIISAKRHDNAKPIDLDRVV